jgi:hypothetical protein
MRGHASPHRSDQRAPEASDVSPSPPSTLGYMWTHGAWDWVIVGGLYVFGFAFFQLLGGFAAAGKAIERWGRTTSIRRARRLGLDRKLHLGDG